MQQSASINKPFTASWIQALTSAADNPKTRTIKPKLDWIDRLSLNRAGTERDEAAEKLWEYGKAEGLVELLAILPVMQRQWTFQRDDTFLYQRQESASSTDVQSWKEHLGLTAAQYSLTAEVTSSEWTSLVREEAVRLQKPFAATSTSTGSTMRLPCTASWESEAWSVRFDQVDWLVVSYEDTVTVPRPSIAETEESLFRMIVGADGRLVPKQAVSCKLPGVSQQWQSCLEHITPFHQRILENQTDTSPWLRRTWACVWPIVYREQNVLRGQADIDTIRSEFAACMTAVPKLVIWMFVFARLNCMIHSGPGLGISADYVG